MGWERDGGQCAVVHCAGSEQLAAADLPTRALPGLDTCRGLEVSSLDKDRTTEAMEVGDERVPL